MAALVHCAGKDGEENKVERVKGLKALPSITSGSDSKIAKKLFALEGLKDVLVKTLGRADRQMYIFGQLQTEKFGEERATALIVLSDLTKVGGEEFANGLFELDGSMKGIIRSLGDGGEVKERMEALQVLVNVMSGGSTELVKAAYSFQGLMDIVLKRLKKGWFEERKGALMVIGYIARGGDAKVAKELFAGENGRRLKQLVLVVSRPPNESHLINKYNHFRDSLRSSLSLGMCS